MVKTTRYCAEQVMRERPYIRVEWCLMVTRSPERREVQNGGRYLRVITLEDGETIHNAFPDRDFRPEEKE